MKYGKIIKLKIEYNDKDDGDSVSKSIKTYINGICIISNYDLKFISEEQCVNKRE